MTGTIEQRLVDKGIILPEVSAPAANYVPFVITGNLIFISGQVPIKDGNLAYIGQVGDTYTEEEGYQSARLCGLNLIAQAKAACGGDLDRIARVVKLVGFVNCTAEFYTIPAVINGASDLMVDVFGKEVGAHTRSAVSASPLPFNVATEVEGIFEIK